MIGLGVLPLLAACSVLPRSGPTISSMMEAENGRRNLALVDIEPSTINLLAAKEEPSLYGTFGDYGPPPGQTIGVGDMLQVTLWESYGGGLFSTQSTDLNTTAGLHSLLTPEQTVGRDGEITVPFAGRVPVVGQTPAQVEWTIRARLAEAAINPQDMVIVTHNISNTVTVLSEGGLAARVPLSVRGDRVLDVIAQAGGIRGAASDTSVILSRGDRIVRVPLEAVLRNPSEDIYMRAGDVLAQVHDPQTFTAVGATGRNNVVLFGAPQLNLDEALAKAGGLLDNRADPSGVFVIRLETGGVARELAQSHDLTLENGAVPTIYHLDMSDPMAFFLAKKFAMRNKDIIFVANSRFNDFEKVLGLVNDLTTPAFTGLLMENSLH
jgi:polysaccharide biosynthesis/export protein